MVEKAFVGTWEIVNCVLDRFECPAISENDILGIRFTLSKNGDVLWQVPDKLKCVPLFSCETYEYHIRSDSLKKFTTVDICFGAYAGQIYEFRIYNIKPKKRIVLSGHDLCEMDCRYVDNTDFGSYSAPFTLLPALEDGYFSDIVVTANNKRKFNVHSTVLFLQATDIDWTSDPPPFANISEDSLGTILYFLYAECLPEEMTESTAEEIIQAASRFKCLDKLIDSCKKYLMRVKLKHEILVLLNDIHIGMDSIVDYISPSTVEYSSKPEVCWTNPSTLYGAIKHCFKEGLVVIAKFVQFCDIFTNKEHNLSNAEQDEILSLLKSKIPIYNQQFRKFLERLKKIYRSMSSTQRLEYATFIVPEVESMLSTVISLLKDIDVLIRGIIQITSKSRSKPKAVSCSRLSGITCSNEMNRLIIARENVKLLLEALILKREQYTLMTTPEQVLVIARILDFFVKEELPVFLIRLDEIVGVFDEKLELHEFKFFFKVETSKEAYALEKLREHVDCAQSVITKICDLVQLESFNRILQDLKLLPLTEQDNSTNQEDGSKENKVSNCAVQRQDELHLVKALCVPPGVQESLMSQKAIKLFHNQISTDMEFEVICDIKDSQNETVSPVALEKRIIKAHRVIVAARCDWFRRALLSGMKEAINKRIEIHDTNPEVFRLFLEYLYGGNLQKKDLSTEQLLELLLLSDRYEVDTLKQTCEQVLKSCVEADSALYFLSLSDQYNANILKKRCMKYISEHHEVTERDEFFELPLSLQSEVFDIIWSRPKTPSLLEHDPEDVAGIFYSSIFNANPTASSSDENQQSEGYSTPKLESQVTQLRNILGDAPSKSYLVKLILAADYNLERAVNFYYSIPSHN